MEKKQMSPVEECSGEKNETDRKKGIDKTLLELSAGIIFWGILCQITVVWLVEDKSGYSIGLWMGVLLAVAAGIHMWWALDRALDFARDTAVKLMTKYNIIRYVVIVIVMALIMISGIANPLSAFLGLMGLKVSAYLQPFTHKICAKLYKECI